MANHSFSRFSRPLIAIAAIAGFLALGVASSASATSPDDHLVTPAELGSAYAAPGETTWLSDLSGGGTNTMTTDAFDGRSSLKMSVPGANGQVNAFKTFGSGVRPTDIPALLAGSSFSYAGNTVNFQIAMFYTPVDIAHYGPQGSTIACTPAVDGGVTLPNMCYTIIKFELLGNSVGAWTTTTLGDKTAAKFIVGGGAEAGWWATKRVGQYIVGAQGAGLPELLAEMTNYQVFAVGASIGKSGPAGDSWLLNLTFGGISNSFGSAATPATPAGSPFSDSAAVQQYISANSINVPGDTANFAPTGDSNTDLSKIESEHTMNGQYDNWQDPTDAFADVYSFSDAAYLGTFPVINGSVVLTNADISALLPGSHYLLFQGQTSGTLGLAAFTVVAPAAALAATGGTLSESTLIVGFLLLAAGIAAFTAGRLGARRQR